MTAKTKEQYRELLETAATLLGQQSITAENEKLDPVRVYNDLKIMMQLMDEGCVKIEVKRSYWIFWRQSCLDLAQGYDELDALRRAGYGGGASAAIDFVSVVPMRSQAVTQRIALPDRKGDDPELFGHYKAQTLLHIDDLKRAGAHQDAIDDVLEEVQDQLKNLQFVYPDREFTNSYAEMYNELFLKYGKLKTGLPELNSALEKGLRPGDFAIISVPTHAGASTLPTRIALEMAAKEKGEKSKTPILDGLRDALKGVDLGEGFKP
jgi:hypothetical protein